MILILFIISFVLGLHIKYALLYLTIPILTFLIYIFIKFKKKVGFISVGFICLGLGLSYLNISYQRDTYKGVVIEAKDNYFILSSGFERLYLSEYDNPYNVGDIIEVKGEKSNLDFVTLESDFDFTTYLNKKSINKQLKNYQIKYIFKNPLNKKGFKKWALKGLNDESKPLIDTLLFSSSVERNNLAIDYLDKLQLLSIEITSGIYISFLLKIITFFLKKVLKEKTANIVSLVILLPFYIFYKTTLSCLRVLVNFFFKNVLFINKSIDPLNGIAFGAIFLLIIDYHNAYQLSYIIGYGSSIFIRFLSISLFRYEGIKKKCYYFFGVNIFFLPLALSFYHSYTLNGPLLRILFTPFFLLLFLSSLLLSFGIPLSWLINGEVNILKNICSFFIKINPTINVPEFNPFIYFLFLCLLFLYLYYLYKRFKPLNKYLTYISLSLSVLYVLPINNLVTEEVSFINVGQGDACFIRKGLTTVLIDTGGNVFKDIAKDNLIPYLKSKRIYDIDLVITTHDDYDHMGALDSLQKNFRVGTYIKDSRSFPLNINGITFYNYNNKTSGEDNELSLVISFKLLNMDFLIMGDAPISVEKEMIKSNKEIPCDILKVGHHGSNTSTCDEFLSYIKPKEAVVSVGKNNKYKHPSSEVINRLKKHNIIIKRTDLEGTITYKNYIFM